MMTLPMKLFSKPGPQLRRIFELSAPKLSRSVAIKSRSPCALSIMGPNVKNPRRNSTIELCCVSSCLLTRAETLIGPGTARVRVHSNHAFHQRTTGEVSCPSSSPGLSPSAVLPPGALQSWARCIGRQFGYRVPTEKMKLRRQYSWWVVVWTSKSQASWVAWSDLLLLRWWSMFCWLEACNALSLLQRSSTWPHSCLMEIPTYPYHYWFV